MTIEPSDLKKCPFCAEDIKAAAIVCKHCNRDLPDQPAPSPEYIDYPRHQKPVEKPSTTKWWLWVPLGAIGLFIVFAIANSNDPIAIAKQRDRDAIDFCWQEQKRKSFDPSTQRFVAGACELMESRFKDRFGHTP